MKCPEAVEWMHRYIDHDLNEEDSSVLFEHMRVCPDCAEKFALLSELSAKLEGLPKVNPPFSIVDSILPDLDAIDRARQEGSAAAEPATMVPMKQDSVPGLGERSQRPERRRNRAYRTGALGLAAAVLLGVFIYQYEPKTIPNAEVESQVAYDSGSSEGEKSTLSQEAADSAEVGAPSSKRDGSGNADGSSPSEATGSSGTRDLESAGNAGNNGGGTAVPDNGSKGDQKVGSSDKAAPASEGNGAPAQNAPNNSGGEAERPQAGTNSGLADTHEGLTSPNQSESRQADPSSEGDAPVMEKAPLAPEEEPEQYFSAADIMGITSFTVNQWTSPDGAYLAEFSEGHLYIYRNDTEQRVALKNETVDGNWVKGEWSEDSQTFTYETEKDGVSALHVVKLDEPGTESDGGSASKQP